MDNCCEVGCDAIAEAKLAVALKCAEIADESRKSASEIGLSEHTQFYNRGCGDAAAAILEHFNIKDW